MRFDMTARALVLEPKDCTTCTHGAGEQGQYTGTKECGDCGGSGRGPRGKFGGCRRCFGRGQEHDFENPIVCPTCDGKFKNFMMENFCDRAPQNAVLSMPIRVVRVGRANTFNENFLGMGCLFSVTDYGSASEKSDSDVLAMAREHLENDRTQATKIVKPYSREDTIALLHDELVVVVTNSGWNVRAVSST